MRWLNFEDIANGGKGVDYKSAEQSKTSTPYNCLYKTDTMFHYDIYRENLIEEDPNLSYNLMVSDKFVFGVIIEHPDVRSYLVPTDRYWKIFGAEEGQNLIVDMVKERLQWQGVQHITEELIEDLNQEFARKIN